ncbi:hypothetical protein MA16_Dca017522 [Dendrobium catenatum]|uniref:Uncharacterized protein n=1 Tax=Dendrobium catenatum TaxID=906689 RepID=A0A2I0X3U7_9ASPA|nr:hypothetical protein MA16_Dca017522 [Dendrobium catenatum]
MSDPVEVAGFKCQIEENADFKERDEVAVNQKFKFNINQLDSRESAFESNSFNALADVDNMDAGLLEDSREIETEVAEELDIQNSKFESSKNQIQAEVSDTDVVLNSKDFFINPKVVETPTFSLTNSVLKFKIPQTLEVEIKEDQILAFSPTKATESTQGAKVLGDHKPDFEFKISGIQEDFVTNSVIGSPSTTLAVVSLVNGNPSSSIIHDFKSRDNSPHSAISLNFKKTILKKDKNFFTKKNESPGSKHILFKELQALGPVKDLPRRKIADHKEKIGLKGSSSLFSH